MNININHLFGVVINDPYGNVVLNNNLRVCLDEVEQSY